MINKQLNKTLKYMPDAPGVYLMKNGLGDIIYIGKALSLNKRVRSYFIGKSNETGKTSLTHTDSDSTSLSSDNYKTKIDNMLKRVVNIEYIVTSTEEEALLLEANLIKRHKPRYNILLKDDKRYPFIKLTLQEPFPRLYVVRQIKKDGSKYFGPYADATTLRKTLRYIEWILPLRNCKRTIAGEFTKSDTTDNKCLSNQRNSQNNSQHSGSRQIRKPYDKPCLNFQIYKCPAPCIGNISIKDYRKVVNDIIFFLNGKDREIIERLKEEMINAGTALQFEKAAKIRDRIATIERIRRSQTIHFTDDNNRDVIAIYKEQNIAVVSVLKILSGKLLNNENHRLNNVEDANTPDILSAFISQYYANIIDSLPHKIMLSEVPTDYDILNNWLKNRLNIPSKGDNRLLMNIAKKNAFNHIESIKLSHLRKTDRTIYPIQELKEKLRLSKLPRKIVCLDVSTIGGVDTVSSMVYFENGKPLKKRYRRFLIKTDEVQNDYAAISETLSRYIAKVTPDDVPDLIVIDGGKGHLNIAVKTMNEILSENCVIDKDILNQIPIISIAKKVEQVFKHNHDSPILLPRSSSALRLLVNIRDEAHRFAVNYHRHKRKKRTLASELDKIKGIGENTKFTLLKQFGSVDNIRKATSQELMSVKGIGGKTAQLIKDNLNSS